MMIRRLILSFLLITTLVACSSEQSPDQSAIAVSQTDEALFKVSGVVTKGPINNALLEIIAFDANDGTESGTPLATTTTDANGNWTVSITPAPTVPLLIKASGGTFIDESDPEPVIANKRSITFGPSESLMGVLYPGFNTASVNILTSAMIEKSRTEAAGTNFLNVLGNNRNIATSALGFDPFTVAATNPLIPAQNASADAIEYAMYLGGIATALNTAAIKLGVAVPDYNIVSHFIQDLSDGVINGVNQVENPLLIDVGNGNVNFPSDINLNNAITRFRNNNYSAYAATSVTDVVTINTALMQTSGVNNEPTAIDDAFATVADTPLITGDVLANDSDPDGDALTISTFTQSANGTVADNGDGSFTFTPTAGFTGNAIFSYTVDDNKGGLDTAQVVVAVSAAPNDDGGGSSGSTPPVANAGADQNVDEQITVNLSGSATDSDGTVTGYSWSQVSGSTVTINNANSANASFDSPVVLLGNIEVLVFQLIATDDSNTDGFDFMTVLVNPVLVDPIADAGPDQTLNELLTVNLDATGSNDGTDGTISSYSWTQLSPVSPVVVFSDPGSATPSFTGPDIANDTTFTFQVTVTDNEGGTATDTVDVTLTSLNAGPTVVDDPSEVAVEDTVTQFTTLLNNDSDPESHTFTINSVSSPTANGGAVIIDSGNTSVTYTPAPNFNGTDTFTYTAIDQFGALSTNSATVTISVAGVNDDPVAVDDSASVTQGFPITITNLMVNDSDPEGDTTNISGVTQGSNGSVVNNFDGSVTYTPNLSFNGDDTFTYTIVDGNGGSDTASVTVTVIPDTDGDGLIDSEETSTYSTNPNIADSDSDGFNDRHEVLAGTNPNDILEFPPGTVISTGNSNNTISSNTTWDLASSPYWVQNDVNVNGGATLTIEAGVVVKFNNNTIDLFVTGNATLDVLGNAPIPQNVRFTSIFDDSIQGDTGGVVGTPAAGNWRGVDFQALSNGTLNNLSVRYGIDCIAIDNSSPQLTGVEVGDCSGYGIYTYSTTTSITSYLRDITVTDFDLNNTSTGNVSVWLGSANSTTNTLDIQNVIIDESNTYSVEIVARNTSNISGSFDDLMVTNSASYGLYIHNDGTGNVDPLLSNISLTNPDSITISHLYIDNNSTGTLSPSFNGTNVISGLDGAGSAALNVVEATPDFLDTGTWSLSDTGYGIVLNGGAGNYNNINIDSVVTAGLLLQAAADPAVFDDVVLTNAFTPYELGGQTITSTISSGYDFSDPSVTKEYIRVGGSLLADTVFTADPLDAIATYGLSEPSIWRVISSLTVPALVTLTVDDGAIVKFDGNHSLNVNGSLIVGDGDGSGPNAVFTSFSDDDYGGDSNNDGASSGIWSDWNQIRANVDGSVIDIDNAIIRYSDYGVVQNNTDTATFDITNTSFLDIYLDGLYLRATNGDTINWNLNNIVFDRVGVNTAYHVFNIVMSGNSTLDGNWFGLTINDTGGDGIYLEDASSGAVTPIISGLTIGDSGLVGRNGVYLIGDSTTEPVFNATSGSGNSISGGNYNLALDGVSGSYSNLTLDGAANAAIYISGTSINPTFWEDSSIILTGGEAPYQLLVDLPSSIGVLGDTGNLGFNTGSSTVPRDYVALGATTTNSINLVSNPLGTDSVYRATSNITVLAGSTLSMQDGAILKMNSGLSITVNGSLIMGDGGPDTDPKSIITSINDSVGGDTNGSDPNNPAWLDWNRITVGEGSTIDI
ncbi:MAG: Ig-like domain-containing protein, partial [Gammaproteobacteria bacterium]|nr:Ig-like domain-containing protein [Gammaproteobacteria bacterium]